MLPLLLPLLWAGSRQQKAEIQLQVQEAVSVQEGLCALVPCSFSYPWSLWPEPPHISWFQNRRGIYYSALVVTNKPNTPVNSQTQGRFRLLGDARTNCSLHIRDARRSDTGNYLVRVERGGWGSYYYRDKGLALQVIDLTETPDIHFLEPLESDRPTNLTCSLPGACEEGQTLTFSWSGAALNSLDLRTLHSSVLTFTPRPQDHGTNITCRVQLQEALGATERTVQLPVSYAPQNLNVSICRNGTALKILRNASSPLSILEGQALHLLCVADGNPPAQLRWFQGSPTSNASLISNSGHLELPHVTTENEGKLTCRAENPLGSRNISLLLSVLYPPQLLGPSCSWEAEGLHCSCSARAQPAPSLHWWLGEELVEGTRSNASFTATSSAAGPWAHGNLSLHGGLGPGLRLSCDAQNAHGHQRVGVLLLPGKLESRSGVVLGALGGAGAVVLLSLCLCLGFFCIVKAHRKQLAGRAEGVDNEDPVMGTVAWGRREKPWPDPSPDQGTPPGAAPPAGEEQNHQYASLSFHGMKPREPGDENGATEYSEIKSRHANEGPPRAQTWPEESQPRWGERRSQELTNEA